MSGRFFGRGRRWAAALCCCAAFAGAPAQQLSPAEEAAVKQFTQRVKDYEATEKKLPVKKLKRTSDIAELERRRIELRAEIVRSRPHARQGDIFTPDVAKVFRELLAETMTGPDGPAIKKTLDAAEPMAPANFKVNSVYPNIHGQPIQSVPGSLLARLPPLPDGLEYRIAGKVLALRDARANLVVDYIPDAMP